jgi:peptidoglycan/xylan/chitin deacetylase (PgdA/CDA1 family)
MGDVIAFLYHVISDESLPHVRHIYPYKSEEMFENDIRYLKEHFDLISYDDLALTDLRKRSRRSNRAIVMFDDGYAECFSVVRPVLLRYGIPCTFFITRDFIDNRNLFYRNKVSLLIERIETWDEDRQKELFEATREELGTGAGSRQAFIGKLKSLSGLQERSIDAICRKMDLDIGQYLNDRRPYLTAEEVRILAADGFTIGAHGRTHTRLDLLSRQAMIDEILGSCEFVRDLTGQERVPFAFPFDGNGIDRSLLKKLMEENPLLGMMFGTGGLEKDEAFILNRIEAGLCTDVSKDRSDIPELAGRAYTRAKIKELLRKIRGKTVMA